MYINEILKYLLWPVVILLSWLFIRIAVSQFEKRQVQQDEKESASDE
jgi:uncharacterized protein YggT (Ycf19 family)